MISTAIIPSLLVFGPQTELPSQEVLAELRQELTKNPQLSSLQDAVKDLPRFWQTLTDFDPSLSDIPGAKYLEDLQRWIVDGGSFPHHLGDTPNVYALPVTVILQITQYLRYLTRLGVRDAQRVVLEGVQAGGVQGFCVGFLSAIAAATSESEAEIASLAAISLRWAVAIGAYVDQDGGFAEQPNQTACLAVRWRDASEQGSVEGVLQTYPDAYISSITDSTCVTITARAADIPSLTDKFQKQGFRVKPVHVQGRFHSEAYSATVEKLNQFSLQSADLQFPAVDKLQAPVRSAVTGELVTEGSFARLALENTLLKPANWYKTLQSATSGLPDANKVVAFAGFGNHIPASLVQLTSLQVFPLSNQDGANQKPALKDFSIGTSVNELATNLSEYPANAIAIVGMSGKFPGADDLDELWQLLLSGKAMVEPAPVERFQLPQHPTGGKWWGNFLKDSTAFDHKFFKKSSREAIAWDPQQRILLEVVYEALENAGYFGAKSTAEPEDYGCYMGAVMNNYYDNVSCHPSTAYGTLGTSRCFISGAMSHYFGWTGPSLTIDTACSSSLVAINTACRAIWSGECSRAIAGGTNVITSPYDYRNLAAAGFLSPNGQCKPFDANADGYCRGEGVGVVVLKPLAAALEEHDNIHGVIVGSAANQNFNYSAITVPHSGSQVNLYRQTMKAGNIDPEQVTYVEAHGTGTGVGDPVEVRSIRDAFGGPTRSTNVRFGSIKGSIGHTEATAGVAGLIKVLLMMQHGKIPAQASHNSLNPKIPALEPDHLEIPRSILPWSPPVRVALVNSYGAAGSNSAVLVREKPKRAIKAFGTTALSKYPLFVSAGSAASLSKYSEKLLSTVQQLRSQHSPDVLLSDLTFNLADRANHSLTHVLATTVTDLGDLQSKLSSAAAGSGLTTTSSPNPVVLVFGGQESDFIGLSEAVYQSSKVFRQHIDHCNDLLLSLGYESIVPAIFQQSPIENLVTLQSALFAVQYASAKSWIDSGLQASAVVGHSFGQLVALAISGALSLPDALKLVAGRAAIMLEHWGDESGSMLFLQTDRQTISNILDAQTNGEYAEIACYNGPTSNVVVGTAKAIEDIEKYVASTPSLRDTRTKRLRVTHGFHSKFTESLIPHLSALAKSVTWRRPTIQLETADELQSIAEPDFTLVAEHTRQPVFFQNAVERLAQQFKKVTWLEVGRGSSVIQLVKGSVPDAQGHLFLSPQLTTANAQGSLTDVTVELWKAGHSAQYWPFNRAQKPNYQYLSLPPYQFEKTRHWLGFTVGRGAEEKTPEPVIIVQEPPKPVEHLTFLQYDEKKQQATFRIAPQHERFKKMLGGHVMGGQTLAPASLYFEWVARAALYLQQDTEAKTYVPFSEDLLMTSPIGTDETKEIILSLKRIDEANPSWTFSITTSGPTASGRMSTPFETSNGKIHLVRRDDPQQAQRFKRFTKLTGYRRYEEIINHPDAETMSGNHVYRAFNHIVHYAENFRGIKKVACVGMEAAGNVRITPDENDPVDQRLVDTPMTDSFMQFAGFLVNYFNNPSLDDVLVCHKIEHIEVGSDFNPDAKEWIIYSNMSDDGEGHATSDAYVFEKESKKMVMAAFGFNFSKMSQSLLARMLKSVNKNGGTGDKADKASDKPVAAIKKPAVQAATAPAPQVKKVVKRVKKAPKPKKASSGSPSKRAELFQVFSNVTDVPVAELNDDLSLEDLGIDSLMATEVLNDIRGALGLTIDLTSFLFFPNLKEIAAYVDQQLGAGGDDADAAEESEYEEIVEEVYVDAPVAAPAPAPVPAAVAAPAAPKPAAKKVPSKRAELFQVFSNVTDIPVDEIKDDTTLEDLGIDSLMATEVLNDIRGELGLTIDLTSFLFFPNIKEIVAYVDQQLGGGSDDSDVGEDTPASSVATPSAPTPVQAAPAPAPPAPATASIPTITDAFGAFKSIRYNYDQLAIGTKAINFWTDAYPDQARLVLAYIVEAYAQLGCDVRKLRAGEAVPQINHLPRHKQLARQFYAVLEDGKYITANGDGFIRTNVPVDPTPAETIYQEILPKWPQHADVTKLTKVVGSEMGDCLIGKKDGLQLVFGSKQVKKTLEDMYEFWPLLRTPTLLLAEFLRKALTNFTGTGKFKLLEIGAGTGGTTRYIVNFLQNHGIPYEYTYTDISQSLVGAAKRAFKGNDNMKFEVLDIEKDPRPEQIAAYHVIIATNCIHATRKLPVSLANIRKMIREDGAMTLVEITKNMFWLDIVVGLFEGWWLFEDGRTHALIDEKKWEKFMKDAGFKDVLWTDGEAPESKTVRVIGAFPTAPDRVVPEVKKTVKAVLEEVVYKKIGDQEIKADVYYPIDEDLPTTKMPVALMIHGGSHIIFSRKDIRPPQTRLLLEKGFLPVSLDHRLCPEVSLSEGPMVDVCDALEWARTTLPSIKLKRSGVKIDGERVVVVGWSSGGQLAMSLAWTAPARGLRPPEAILAFYCPTNYEDPWWQTPIQPIGAEDRNDDYDILEGIKDEPITNYGIVGAWEPLSDPRIRTDPRCRIVLHINWKAQTLPIIIGGHFSKESRKSGKNFKALPQPTLEQIRNVSPQAHIKAGDYKTPTFMVHGTADDLIPWEQSQGTYEAFQQAGITAGLALVDNAPHICDLSSDPESEGWKAVIKGYEFLSSYV